jgi:hypothetical protein
VQNINIYRKAGAEKSGRQLNDGMEVSK